MSTNSNNENKSMPIGAIDGSSNYSNQESVNIITEQKESNLTAFANQEIDILLKTVPDAIIKDYVPEILALVIKFSKSGQSGGSAPYTAGAISSAIKKLLLFDPISPVTGIDEEWTNVSDIAGPKELPLYQNKRCSALFKNDTEAYYLDAIIWKNQKGHGWSGSAKLNDDETLLSRGYVKEFPFVPKTFYIDVIEEEVAPDDWVFHIKDPKQLEEAFEYYKPFYKTK